MIEDFEIEVGGARISGEQVGTGRGLIFLHAGVADRRMWREQLMEFGQDYRAVAYDRRGFGTTRSPDERFSHGEDLGAVLDQLGMARVILAGCSQGGRIAIDFALTYPQRVEALVLIAPAISGAPEIETLPAEIEILVEALDRAEEADDRAQINAIEAHLWLDGPTSLQGRVGGELRELFLDMNGIALEMPDFVNEIEPASAYARLSELSLPTLVICGDLDFPHVRARCQYLADAIPGCALVELVGVAHLPNLEQPDAVNRLLQDFLNSAR